MKKSAVIILTLLLLLSLTGCGREESSVIEAELQTEEVSRPQLGSEQEVAVEQEDVNDNGETETAENPEQSGTEVVYYRGNDSAEYFIEEYARLSTESPEPQDIIELLIAEGVLPEGVIVNDWSSDGSCMWVDFNSAFQQALQGMGSAGEYIMLGSTVNSLIRNFGLSGINISVEGEVLATGHSIYDYTLEFFQ